MATALNANLYLKLSAILESGIAGVSSGSELGRGALDEVLAWTPGNGAGQANRVWYGDRYLPSGGYEDLTLYGVLTDTYGNSISFNKVYVLAIKNPGTTASSLEVGPSPVNGFGVGGFWKDASDRNVIAHNNGVQVLLNRTGVTVTVASADSIRVTNAGPNETTYRISILGAF
jgi:hypothetical protein